MTATAQKVDPLLKGLSKRQLAVVEVMLKTGLMFDITEDRYTAYRGRRRPLSATLAWPEDMNQIDRTKAADAFTVSLGRKSWYSYRSNDKNVVATSLFRKGLLVEVAEIKPETKDKDGYRTYGRVARYTLSNAVREAAGGIAVALADIKTQEQQSVAREAAWNEALAPLNTEFKLLRQRASDIRYRLSQHLTDPTPDALVEAHKSYQQIVAELNELNALLKVQADLHKRTPEPYTLY